MVRSELVAALCAKQPHLLPRDVELAVNCIINQIVEALEQGDRIEVRGFGAFSLRQRPGRIGRNPMTGEPVNVPSRAVVHFKPGTELRDRVDAAKDQYRIID